MSIELCPTCHGSGSYTFKDHDQYGPHIQTHPCKKCGGVGWMNSTQKISKKTVVRNHFIEEDVLYPSELNDSKVSKQVGHTSSKRSKARKNC